MASVPGPPPSTREPGHTGVASVRLRRTSAVKPVEPPKTVATSNQEFGSDGLSRKTGARVNHQGPQLFTFQLPRREQLESNITIAALQENISALTVLNQREKALSALLRQEVAQLTEAIAKLNKTRETEKVEKEKNVVHQKQKTVRGGDERLLPDIHNGSMLSASTVALQQHTQMEVSYQRKVLSFENRCLHMTENNKKLLSKIEQLENAQTETIVQLGTLRRHNAHLLTEAENLNSTINSQSALIVGLRSTVQRLNHDEKLVENLRNTFERCQRELESVKKRGQLLQEEHAKLKTSSSQEKGALMSKILDFQQRLQRNKTASGNVTVLEKEIKRLLNEREPLQVELEASTSRCYDLQAHVFQLNKMSEEFVEVKRTMENEIAEIESLLNITRQELEICIRKQRETEERAQKAEAHIASLEGATNLLQTRDEEIGILMQKMLRLEDDVNERDQRYAGLQDEFHKVNTELQGLKQLSQDDTVQALQMARQKAATYEALTLLNEEKQALEGQLRLAQERLEAGRVALHEAKDANVRLLAELETHALSNDELRKENKALLEQQKENITMQEQRKENTTLQEQINNSHDPEKPVAEVATQTIEELISIKTHAQTASDLEKVTSELESIRSEFEELQQSHNELQDTIQNQQETQDQMEVGYKKTVSRERYKSESFQSQLVLLQNENGELSEKVEALYKDLRKEQQLDDAHTLEMMELKQRVLSREAIQLLRKTQDSLEQTVNSLLEAENASESTFTCLQCMQLFTQPMTLAPCGHTYCAACLTKCGSVEVPSSIACKMCESGIKRETECIFPNYALADLTARFIFRQQSLASLTTMCVSLRNNFTKRDPNSSSTGNLTTEA
ncbi:hypothetical protein PI124_g13887 [Phytophthora idaei]|nr:hypothetical protein PI125_g13505 [Phytophthora idaei]KAG3148368.1 hypothetical protein PI126_g12466 [Phytophthora idaei]KAG3241238.1 hypothetical protein PI124_g13887 [Phytophthora idaei]